MNVKELIEKYKSYEGKWNAKTGELARQIFLEDLQQLDEPKLVKVPQFVAEHIKRAKEIGRDLQDAMNSSSIHEEVEQWLYTDNNMDTFARAWLDGYEIEEEKRYIVSLKNGQPLVKSQSGNTLYFNQNITAGNYKFTRKQLEEADFGWVFDCPGIEIEEVEYDTNA